MVEFFGKSTPEETVSSSFAEIVSKYICLLQKIIPCV